MVSTVSNLSRRKSPAGRMRTDAAASAAAARHADLDRAVQRQVLAHWKLVMTPWRSLKCGNLEDRGLPWCHLIRRSGAQGDTDDCRHSREPGHPPRGQAILCDRARGVW